MNSSTPSNAGGIQGRGMVGDQASGQNQNRIPCEFCGLFNHLSKDCRRQNCEICGLGNHTTYNYRRCVP